MDITANGVYIITGGAGAVAGSVARVFHAAGAKLALVGHDEVTLRQRADFSEEENRRVFGKCSNPNGHGHRYRVQATLAGRLDERSGTLLHLGRFGEAIESTLGAWDGRHLDLEVEEFHESPSTGENILRALWPRLDSSLDGLLVRLRLFETENNRFTLRRQAPTPTRS